MLGFLLVSWGDVSEWRVSSDSILSVAASHDCNSEREVDLKGSNVTKNGAEPALMEETQTEK